MEIKLIAADQTYDIRHQVLRPNQTLDACHYPLDFLQGTIHTGAFIEGQLISIASFFIENSPEFDAINQYRLRGMATLPEFRKHQAGSSQVKFAEEIMKSYGVDLWWCNARTTVSAYYEKLGLTITGSVFDIDPIGPHVLMYKEL